MTTNARRRTALVLAGLIVLALVWEIYAIWSGEGQAWTFSRLVWDLTANPLFVFASGMLAGHFFFPKSACLHCGFLPYRRDLGSMARFDAALKTFAVFWDDGRGQDMDGAKRAAGFPRWLEW